MKNLPPNEPKIAEDSPTAVVDHNGSRLVARVSLDGRNVPHIADLQDEATGKPREVTDEIRELFRQAYLNDVVDAGNEEGVLDADADTDRREAERTKERAQRFGDYDGDE